MSAIQTRGDWRLSIPVEQLQKRRDSLQKDIEESESRLRSTDGN